MPKEAYNAAYEKFNEKYGIYHDLYTEYVNVRTFNALDDFTFEDPKKKELNYYLSTLASALDFYLYEKTKIGNAKVYDFSDISFGKFIEDFDDVMKEIRADIAAEKGEKRSLCRRKVRPNFSRSKEERKQIQQAPKRYMG